MGTKEKKSGSGKRKFSDSEKRKILREFKAHKGPKDEFFRAQGIPASGVYRWLKEAKEKKAGKAGPAPRPKIDGPTSGKVQERFVARKEAVEAFLKSGSTLKEFSKVWGVSHNSLARWCKVYEERGAKGLESGIYGEGKKRGRKGSSPHLKAQIVAVQTENPNFGLKKVRDFLFRFRGVKASTGTVRKTIVEAKLPRAPVRAKKRKRSSDKVRRFERAKAMQLWQSDITSFVLTRHSQRVYLTVYMDDHSRYIVAWSLQLRQKSDLVMDSLLMGIQRFGKPEEVLTDQGRQYFSWRGKSDFQKLLDKEGIRHVVARSHHPQTLGKCERFWETVGQEFWERVKPQELEDTRERLGHFIAHYNHFRPHQGLDGMTPADRFFGLAVEIRKAVEATFAQNELRLAVGEAPRSPVFLIGQIGDQPVSLHGESGNLVVQTPGGGIQRLEYSSFGHAAALPVDLTLTQPKGLPDVGITVPVSSSDRNSETGNEEPESEKAASDSSETAAGRDPVVVGVGNDCRAGAGPPDGRGADGVLDGSVEQAGDRYALRSSDGASLAAVAAGDLGYGGRIDPPTEASNEKPVDSTRGRPEEAPAPNHGTREPSRAPAATDRDPPGDAALSGSDAHKGSSGEGDAVGSPATEREGCKTSQEGPRTQEELENTDDDIPGRRR
jgi:transposase InsO family protein/transposase-like protein